MVKQNKIFSLDPELIDKLKDEDSASALVNKLLISHYEGDELDGFSVKELLELKTLVKQRDDAERDIKSMEVMNAKRQH